jgi:biopolymer transport protein ExbB|tara:strand:+ start:545 stop:1162 length:618 start_codon:yes stop_codon:yes gene_type:complete
MGNLFSALGTGGPIIAILGVLSIISLTLIGTKWLQLSGLNTKKKDRVESFDIWKSGDKKKAIDLLDKNASPLNDLVKYAMQSLMSDSNRSSLDSELTWRGNAEVLKMSKYIRIIELIAMISPLLGLLGTVLGMIQSFQELEMAQGSANASVLAGGIWQALLTTAAGLVVAIPAAVGATLLSEKVERSSQLMEGEIGRLFSIEDNK